MLLQVVIEELLNVWVLWHLRKEWLPVLHRSGIQDYISISPSCEPHERLCSNDRLSNDRVLERLALF